MKKIYSWTEFTAFPLPDKGGYLMAPIGAGVYELKNIRANQLVYVGESKNVAKRMSSLLPRPYGPGGRNNMPIRNYILKNIKDIHYRTLASINKTTANLIQNEMIDNNKYLFN